MIASVLREIYFAGGCFWGVEGYFKAIPGIKETDTGYANGKTNSTSYRELRDSGHAETVKIIYDSSIVSLQELMAHYFRIINPTSLNKQGNDEGCQYRTGIYYTDISLEDEIKKFIDFMQKRYEKKILVEVLPLKNFVLAEEYHQDYLQKNPGGYCHIDLALSTKPLYDEAKFASPPKEDLKKTLTEIQCGVIQEKPAEKSFAIDYENFEADGIYTDIITGKPLFSSRDKCGAGCGWIGFTKPITTSALMYLQDKSLGLNKTEAVLKTGGVNYCISDSALKFVPYSEMLQKGYDDYLPYVKL